jgi:hypothetical protein
MMQLKAGDIIRLKKMHPCGSNEWQVINPGIDVLIKCLQCNKQVLMERSVLERRIRALVSGDNIVEDVKET